MATSSAALALGIDFGTSHSRVSYFNPATDDTALLRFRTEFTDLRQYSVPSLVVWNGNEWLYGYEAEAFRYSADWNARSCREYRSLKRRLFPPEVQGVLEAPGTSPLGVDAAIGGLLRCIVQLADKALRARFPGFPIQRTSINVSVPVLFDDASRRRLLGAYQTALGREGQPSLIVNEPTAAAFAAYHFRQAHDFPPGGSVVFDAGAGSTDITVFNRVGPQLYILASTAASTGGDLIDERLFRLLEARLRHGLLTIPADLSDQLRAQMSQIRACKERLSSREADICVIQPQEVEVTRADLEQAIAPEVRQIIDPLVAALRGAFNSDRSFRLNRILLSGGSSYIPCLRSRVKEEAERLAAEYGYREDIVVEPVNLPFRDGEMPVDPVLAAVGLGTSYPGSRFAEIRLGSVPYEVELVLGRGRTQLTKPVFDAYRKLPADLDPPVAVDTTSFSPFVGDLVFRRGESVRHQIPLRELGLRVGVKAGLLFYVHLGESGVVTVRLRVQDAKPRNLFSGRLPFNELVPWNPYPTHGIDRPLSERLGEREIDDWR